MLRGRWRCVGSSGETFCLKCNYALLHAGSQFSVSVTISTTKTNISSTSAQRFERPAYIFFFEDPFHSEVPLTLFKKPQKNLLQHLNSQTCHYAPCLRITAINSERKRRICSIASLRLPLSLLFYNHLTRSDSS